MKAKEAIEILRHIGGSYGDVSKYHAAVSMAISALEKQEWKKPIDKRGWPKGGRETAEGRCPRCGSDLICLMPKWYSEHGYYCRDCGQRIDWSDEE